MITVKKAVKEPRPVTRVFDTGRRGGPRPGCDCVQCFGYCIIDRGLTNHEAEPRRKTWSAK